MNNFEMFSFLLIMYFMSFVCLAFDIRYTYTDFVMARKIWFYLLTNGMLLLRVFGPFVLTILIHILMQSLTLYLIYITYTEERLDQPEVYIYFMPLYCQVVSACVLMGLRATDDDPLYAGIHGTIGVWVVAIFYWNNQYYKQTYWGAIFAMTYMLMFLGIMLMPDGVVVDLATNKQTPDEHVKDDFGPCGPGPV